MHGSRSYSDVSNQTRGNGSGVAFSDVDAVEMLLHYGTSEAGGCRILTHPKWGTAVYPATMYAVAPREVVLDVVKRVAGV